MALNKTGLKNDIKALLDELKTYDGSTGKEQDDAVEYLADGLADALDTFVKTASVSVSTNVTVASVTAVTPGAGVSGPGTGSGTGSGTIS